MKALDLRDILDRADTAYRDGELAEALLLLEPLAKGVPPLRASHAREDLDRLASDPVAAAAAWASVACARLRCEVELLRVHPVGVNLAMACALINLDVDLVRHREMRRKLLR